MDTDRTTYRALNTRAAKYVSTLAPDDPIVVANCLVNEAVALQDEGRVDEAMELLARAEALLA